MTKPNIRKRHKLSREILGVLAITFVIALFLFQLLSIATGAIIDSVLFMQDIVLTQAQYKQVDDWTFNRQLGAAHGAQHTTGQLEARQLGQNIKFRCVNRNIGAAGDDLFGLPFYVLLFHQNGDRDTARIQRTLDDLGKRW